MMYRPKLNIMEDREWILRLVREDPFATVISGLGQSTIVSHLPFLIEEEEGSLRLVGHLARANPQFQFWKEQNHPEAYVIFHGPHGFITPTWYEENSVPTWNYAVVHMRGLVKLVEDFAGIEEILKRSVVEFEQGNPRPWNYLLPVDLSNPHIVERAIAGFTISVENVEAKFKLSQNRSRTDQERVIRGLVARGDASSCRLADWMRGVLKI